MLIFSPNCAPWAHCSVPQSFPVLTHSSQSQAGHELTCVESPLLTLQPTLTSTDVAMNSLLPEGSNTSICSLKFSKGREGNAFLLGYSHCARDFPYTIMFYPHNWFLQVGTVIVPIFHIRRPKRLSNLLPITQLISGEAEIQIQVLCDQSLSSGLHITLH